jgi:hypothetical protein
VPNGEGLSLAHSVEKSSPAVPVIVVSGNLKSNRGFELVGEAVPSRHLADRGQEGVPIDCRHKAAGLMDPPWKVRLDYRTG